MSHKPILKNLNYWKERAKPNMPENFHQQPRALNIQRPQKTQVVEHFDRIQVASFLQMNSKTCSLTHWILEIYGAWLKDFGQKICLHEKNDVILNWHDRNVNTWYFLQVSWQFVEMQTCKGRGNSENRSLCFYRHTTPTDFSWLDFSWQTWGLDISSHTGSQIQTVDQVQTDPQTL